MNLVRFASFALMIGAISSIAVDLPAEAQGTSIFPTPSSLQLSLASQLDQDAVEREKSVADILRGQKDPAEDTGNASPQTLGERMRADTEKGEMEENSHETEADEESSRTRLTAANVRRLRKPIDDIVIRASEAGKQVPPDTAALYSQQEPMIEITSLGASPPLPDRYLFGFTHRPLYFEQPLLERCGRGCHFFQNAISGVQFFANTILLPYHMCVQPADCPIPCGGECLTCQPYPVDCNPFPLDRRAMITEAAAIAGFTFLLL